MLNVSEESAASIFRVTEFGSVGCQNDCEEEVCRLCSEGYGKRRRVRRCTELIGVIQETII